MIIGKKITNYRMAMISYFLIEVFFKLLILLLFFQDLLFSQLHPFDI